MALPESGNSILNNPVATTNILDNSNLNIVGRIALLLIILYWSYHLLFYPPSQPAPWIFLDNLNLIFHEAGHWIWLPFGQFMHVLGGSLTQCLIPIMAAVAFIRSRDWTGLSFSLFWLGDNLINVSFYIGDARARVLPFLGGDGVIHDWNWLLTNLNLLNHDTFIAQTVHFWGLCCLVTTITLLGLQITQRIRSTMHTME